ncbi:hypothetical protein predicted by Glimmer/Critica [Sorangium cellulosum So ce56]|uniref:NurA domain-containing protein n=1 Tax=Sorangium cellulosum (strain So ce56) TaxID=448385 RepID=A9GGD8_SORC5|nr:hypothetical protein [Sorangium cellulosum]CAN96314.1 hypothetical protein predicted by Glimmer/Critica [Sorangium cellulosum So ce56]
MPDWHHEPSAADPRPPTQPAASAPDDGVEKFIGDPEYEAAFGEELKRTLDVDTWATGPDWEGAVARLTTEVRSAVDTEDATRRLVRDELLPRLGTAPNAPAEAGVYRATPDELTKVHEGLLFPGRVEAVNGTTASHATLPLGITQIGVAISSYGGVSATFAQRVFRKEIAGRAADPFQAALDIIDRRHVRSGAGSSDALSELVRRGIMTYAERKILIDKATADWRLGYRAPFPYELLTGSGSMRFLEASLDVMRRIVEYERFVFVASDPKERGLLTLGNALAAGEYAVIGTIESAIHPVVRGAHYATNKKEKALDFVRQNGSRVLYGLYSASEQSPPCIFYAHRKHVHIAARIAIADSILRPARGFPMLLDVADATCKSAFGAAGFVGLVHNAYSQAGSPLRYFSDRETRG